VRSATLQSALSDELGTVATPFLLIDLQACDANIAFAADYFRPRTVKLRPHFKAHKCVELMRRQLAAGSCSGVTCATGWEALHLARAGVGDILIANELMDPWELRALAAAARIGRVTVAVDDTRQVTALTECAHAGKAKFSVLVDVDIGQRRGGLDPEDPALEDLVRAVESAEELDLLGLMGYEGHAVLEPDRQMRLRLVHEAAGKLSFVRDRFSKWGSRCEVVSGGGTGSFDMAAETGVWTEIQAGSYVLMDATYEKLDLPFRPAVFCVATLSSRHGERGTLNAGLKSLSAEYGVPRAIDPSVNVLGLSDEHARVALSQKQSPLVGDRVMLVPGHIDPTMNLHSFVYVNDGLHLQRWAIDGRTRGFASE
jgi:D-serine deaminase-like pyridoxal phosphate-dependent protein